MATSRSSHFRLILSAALGAVAGLAFAFVAMHAAWEHNPQAEFRSESGIDWLPWLAIGVSWFAVAAPAAAIVVYLVHSLISGWLLKRAA